MKLFNKNPLILMFLRHLEGPILENVEFKYPLPEQGCNLSMQVGDIGDHAFSLVAHRDREQMDTLEHLEGTPHHWALSRLSLLVWNGLVLSGQLLPQMVFGQRIDQLPVSCCALALIFTCSTARRRVP